MPASLIRTANLEDHAALEDLKRRASLTSERYRELLLAHPEAMEVPRELIEEGLVFVAEARGTLLGFACIGEESEDTWDLLGLFVEPRYWGLSIGTQLVEHCAEFVGHQQSANLQVICDDATQPFYEKRGFKQIGSAATLFGPAVLMQLGA